MSEWKNIWSCKVSKAEELCFEKNNIIKTFSQLKHLMGISKLNGNDITAEAFIDQFRQNLKEMSFSYYDYEPLTFFDVGCGTGSYLYLLNCISDKYEVGGVDYSASFVEVAKKVSSNVRELYCGEAAELNTDIRYDVVFSRSIFQYFDNEDYAETVVRKMLDKCNYSIGIFDVHDPSKKEDYINYRRSIIKDYDQKYAETPHLFLPKELFIRIADERKCSIKFTPYQLVGYWNSPYTYNVIIYK